MPMTTQDIVTGLSPGDFIYFPNKDNLEFKDAIVGLSVRYL